MTKVCVVCGREFRLFPSVAARRVTCSNPCKYRRLTTLWAGQAPVHATAERLERSRIRSRGVVQARFGELSVRELDLIKHVWKQAYHKGYQKGITRQRRIAGPPEPVRATIAAGMAL